MRPQSHFTPLPPYTVVNGSDSLSRLQRTRTTRTIETRRDKKGSISRNSLGPFQTRSQNLRANLHVVPDIFFDQEAVLENGNQVTHKNQKLGSLVDSRRRGRGAILVFGAIEKRNRGKTAVRSSCLLAMVRRKRRVLSYRLSGETPAGAYKGRRVSK